ncbi:unnamed protein product, partial [Aphis gossypii]
WITTISGFSERFKEYVEDTDDLLDPTIEEIVMEMLGKGMVPDFVNLDTMVNESRPLTFAIASLETYFQKFSWDESTKKEIVQFISVVEKHCNQQDLRRHLSIDMLNYTYEIVHGYMRKLNEFDVDQRDQITKAVDSLHGHIMELRRGG